MNHTRDRKVRRQGAIACGAVMLAFLTAGCSDRGITNPSPMPGGNGHPGFDTALYPGDATMNAWRKPSSPYEWVGYYLQAPCHHDPSWMGKRATLTAMGWGLAVLFVGQQTFDGVPDIQVPPVFNRSVAGTLDGLPLPLPLARTGVVTPSTAAEMRSGVVTCSRTLLTTEQGATDAIDAVTKAASEGFANGTVIFLDIEHMDAIPASMEAYYRAWVQQVLADGRFRPGIYVHKANAEAIYAGVGRAYSDMGKTGNALFWVTSSTGFSIDRAPQDVGFPWASVWQGMYEVTQTWNGASVNIDVDVAAMRSPSSP